MKKNNLRFLALMLTFFTFSLLSAQEREIFGKVVDRTTKEGIAGAQVILFPQGTKVLTGANGNYSLKAGISGDSFLQIMKNGYQSVTIRNNIEEVYAELMLSAQVEGQKIIVSAKRDQKEVIASRNQVDRKTMKQSTAQLFDDAVQVLKTMPGVVSTGDFNAQMYVRGGEFYESAHFLNNAFILVPYIWGGAMSVFNPNLIDKIDFYSGAFPAQYGPAMSGIVDVKSRDGNAGGFSGFAELSLTSFSFLYEGPLGEPGKTNDTFVIALRRTHYDLAMNQVTDRSGVKFPYFYDAQLHFKFQLDDFNILRLGLVFVTEGSDISFEDVEEDDTSVQGWKKGNEFHYRDYSFLQTLNLTSALADNFIVENTLAFEYKYGDFEYVDQDSPAKSVEEWKVFQYKLDMNLKLSSHSLKSGFGSYLMWYNLDLDMYMRGIPANFDPVFAYGGTGSEGDPYLLIALPGDSFQLKWESKKMWRPYAYFQDDLELVKDALFLNLGVRADYLNITDKIALDPRLGLKWTMNSEWTMKLAAGQYSDYPILGNGIFLTEEYGNPDVRPERSYHLVGGVEYETGQWFVRLDGFGKYYKDLITQDYLDNFRNGGIGYAYGFDLFIQKKQSKSPVDAWDRFDGWVSYSFIVARRKVTDRISPEDYNALQTNPEDWVGQYEVPFNTWYTPSYDRPHTLSLVLNYTFGGKWRLETTSKIGSGAPYTPLAGRNVYQVDLESEVRYGAVYGDYNVKRTGMYYKTDIKYNMPFFWEDWSSFIQVINLVGRDNVEQVLYDETYTKKREQTGLPRMFIFGIRAEF